MLLNHIDPLWESRSQTDNPSLESSRDNNMKISFKKKKKDHCPVPHELSPRLRSPLKGNSIHQHSQ